ncbi:MAG: hypothetical protein ACRC0R_02700 [Cetobacterium sp.]
MDLFAKYGRKRYIFTKEFSESLKIYIKSKPSKDFMSRLNNLLSGELKDSYEIGLFLSSFVTHSILASRFSDINTIADTKVIIKCLNDYLSGDESSVVSFIEELSNIL